MSYSNGLGNLQHLLGNLATNASQTAKTNQTADATSTSATKLGSADAAQISAASGLVSKSVGGSDVRLDKVASLQQAISSGSYNVSAGDVANSIINSLLS